MKNNYRYYKAFDFILLGLVIILSIIGIMLVGSATRINLIGITGGAYEKQKILFLMGCVLLLLSAFINYEFICKFYIPIYILNLMFLVYVLLFTSDDGTGVNRWIGFGSFGIQPSEFSKIFMILFMSKFIDKHRDKINNFWMIIIMAILIIIPVGLIYKQPSLSASLIVLTVSASILFIGGLNYKLTITAITIGIVCVSFVYFDAHLEEHIFIDKILSPYMIDRITGASTDQTNSSIQAIASGQLSGKGLYQGSVNQLNYLSMSHNDFIFAVLGEEFGFTGSVAVIAITTLIVLKCLITAYSSNTFLGKLIASGVGVMIGFQAFFHIGVGIGLLPNTGIAYPFMSTGGSALWINMIGIGLVINVGMSRTKSIFEE